MHDALGIKKVLNIGRGTFSKYTGGAYVLNNDTYVPQMNTLTNIEPLETDVKYKVEAGFEDLRVISVKFYGNMNLAWALASVNRKDAMLNCTIGEVLRIPTLDSLYERGLLY